MKNIALVVGATGITGSNLAEKLIEKGWMTYGLARNPNANLKGLIPVAADLLNPEDLAEKLAQISPTHVFFTSWLRNDTEAENIRVNGTMVRNLLNTLSEKRSVQHVALVTGLKHYLGPFEEYAKAGTLPETPVREEHPRLNLENFYYAQEDEIYAASERDGFTWSIHRPHSVVGKAVGNLMNMGTTIAVYASICKETGRPFHFPGSAEQWNGLSDVTDARVLAEQMIWAAITPKAHNEAFNVTNGDIFRWKWLWKQIAEWFGIEPVGFDGVIHSLEKEMATDADLWKKLAAEYNLKESEINRLASAWHTDLDLGRPMEVMTDMSKSRKLGFTVYQDTRDSFFDLFQKLRNENLIP
ncbi:Nucleoside-diphosphate-sugar epimerase [Dyadobacter koreensis]|uniref:Nucleoside-diphosphate-sugar epimerase n=1 Tax=Dyadobacter koreensis TaxID=408657 RepID=A0A1H6R2Y5_9BACT|nr:SDR family oxidoreductase [Dyadobacter koreensis]SEI45552.1 Nucleoside-diphosphate-sugar epimerase [Dyadobacter koreensis]